MVAYIARLKKFTKIFGTQCNALFESTPFVNLLLTYQDRKNESVLNLCRSQLNDRKISSGSIEKLKVVRTSSFKPFTRTIIYHESEKKWAKDQVLKVAFTLHVLGSGPTFDVRLRYCACDQRVITQADVRIKKLVQPLVFCLFVCFVVVFVKTSMAPNKHQKQKQNTHTHTNNTGPDLSQKT